MIAPEAPAGRTSRRALVTITLALAAVAIVIYRPWASRPFDTLDFSEFLPFLRRPGGPWTHLSGMLGYYVGEQGRLNLLSYVALVAKWELFGDHTAWWRWMRVAELMVIVGGVYALARRLGASTFGAVAGASLFVCSRLSGEAWTRLTMGEPLGIGLMLWAMLLACGWREDPSPHRGARIALLVVGGILAKETVAGLAPLVWIIAATRDGSGRLGDLLPRRELLRSLLWIGIPAVLTFGAAAAVALSARGEGFSTLYGSTHPSVATFVASWQRPWQIQGLQDAPGSWALPANTLLALLSVGGVIAAARRSPGDRRHALWVTGCAIVLGATYALLYLPWPFLSLYYAMPFLLGPALLLAVALTALEGWSTPTGQVGRIGWALMVLAAFTSTERATHGAIAVEEVNGDLVQALADYRGADSIVVARSQAPLFAWLGTAPRLRRHLLATGLADSMPPMVDRLCRESAELLRRRPAGVVLVSYWHWCGPIPDHTTRSLRVDRYIAVTWRHIEAGVDTFGVDLLATLPR